MAHVSLSNFHVGVVYHLRNPFNLSSHLLRIIHNSRRLLNAYKVIFRRRIGHVLDLAVRVQQLTVKGALPQFVGIYLPGPILMILRSIP